MIFLFLSDYVYSETWFLQGIDFNPKHAVEDKDWLVYAVEDGKVLGIYIDEKKVCGGLYLKIEGKTYLCLYAFDE